MLLRKICGAIGATVYRHTSQINERYLLEKNVSASVLLINLKLSKQQTAQLAQTHATMQKCTVLHPTPLSMAYKVF